MIYVKSEDIWLRGIEEAYENDRPLSFRLFRKMVLKVSIQELLVYVFYLVSIYINRKYGFELPLDWEGSLHILRVYSSVDQERIRVFSV